ncbi:MAG: AsmA family protein [Bacteroidetes bacterium]|nr:AsmA family protein [Bacteroidota bacterium]
MPKWLKYSLKAIAALLVLGVLLVIGTLLYVTYNKDKILKLVSAELNQKLDGRIIIGDMRPQFFKRFPNVSLELRNVKILDRKFTEHHHILLDAKEFYVSLNAVSLFTGKASIKRIDIDDASADLYTDSTGYSNLSVFGIKHKKSGKRQGTGGPPPELQQFSFSKLDLKVDDKRNGKLFHFTVNDMTGSMSMTDEGWQSDFHLGILAHSMSFKTKNGSFIKNQPVTGDFSANGDEDGKIMVRSDALRIGPNTFKLDAVFGANKRPADFAIHLTCDEITWRQASALLADNIKRKLDQYNISQPVSVTARINGSFAGGGDPFLYITAKIRNSDISTPVIMLNSCSLNAIFTNNYQNGKGFNDDNSVIRFKGLTGSYKRIPFTIDTGKIADLNKPIATGNLRADFPAAYLNALLGSNIAHFTKGRTAVSLIYRGDIVNYELNKPFVYGSIDLKNVNVTYVPDNLKLVNSSISLDFIKNALVLRNIRMQTGHSVVFMNGRIKNFMNLYYTEPQKIVFTMQIHSPQLYLGEFLGFLGATESEPVKKPRPSENSGNAIDQLSNVLEKSSTEMNLDVDNVHYRNFLATDGHAELLTSEDAVGIKNVSLKHAGGVLRMSGLLQKGSDLNKLSLSTTISHVDVNEFFKSFDNFGLSDFTSDNLRGFLSAKTQITAGLTDEGQLVKNSINGTLDVNLQRGELVDFKPIYSIGKFAFPFRDLKHIRIHELNARFDVNGDKFKVYPLKLSSSAINMDVSGEYGISKGTDLFIDVPLRNPKKDTTITDPQKLEKKRYHGIVLHLEAKLDSTGKIKIGLVKGDKKKED